MKTTHLSMAMALALVYATGLACSGARAQDRYDDARRKVASAQALQQSGRWNEAQAALSAAETACGTNLADRSCRLLLKYSTGYLSEKEADGAGDRRDSLLEAAAERYREVLEEAPQHESTLKGLVSVHQKLGRAGDAERVLVKAVETDRSGTGASAMLLGQFYREARRVDDALAAFDRATVVNPNGAAAPQAIVALHASLPTERLPALLPRLDEWAVSFPAVAEEGYRRIIIRMPMTAAGERALLAWVSVVSRQGWIAPANFTDLPRAWGPVDEMVRYALTPEVEPPSSAWWMQRPMRRSVLAEIAVAAGQAADVRSEPPRGLRRMQVGMRIAPSYEAYVFGSELKTAWPTRLELARAQLSLLSRHPALDPGEKLQRDLIDDLFVGKAGAYQSEDLAAMQRFHVTLGRWYAERHQWASGGASNGRFQLERAIETAERRAVLGEPYQPLQEEKLLLAGGYVELKEPAKARDAYLDAAEAFLDTDQREPARGALSAAERIFSPPPSGTDSARAELLNRIIFTRGYVEMPGTGYRLDESMHAWLRDDTTHPFVVRQQFKAWSDLADKAQAAGAEGPAATYAGIAFEAALRSKSMVGTADLVRLEHVKGLALARADVAQRRNAIIAKRPIRESGAKSWPLYVPNEGRTTYVNLSADAALAGRLDAAIRREPVLSGRAVHYTVDNGQITLAVPDSDPAADAAARRLQVIPGVTSLSMSP